MSVTVARILQIEPLRGAKVIAGHSGLDNPVEHLDIIEVPDADAWIRSGTFLLTTAFAFKEDPQRLVELIEHLGKKGAAALAVKPTRFLGKIPEEATSIAEYYQLPIIELPVHLAYIDITTPAMTLIINEQALQLKRSETVHRVLTDVMLGGGGLGQIAEALVSLLNNPVVVMTKDLQVRTRAFIPESPELEDAMRHLVNELIRSDSICSRSWDERLPRRVDLAFPTGASAIITPVMVDKQVCGFLVVLELFERVSHIDWLALEKAATAIALDLLRERTLTETRQRMEHDFLMDLLHGDTITEEIARERAAYFGWNVGGNVGVIVVDIDDFAMYYERSPKDESEIQRVKEVILEHATLTAKNLNSGAITAKYSDGAVVLVPDLPSDQRVAPAGSGMVKLATSIHESLKQHLSPLTVSLGVGGTYSLLSQAGTSFREAQKAVEIGRLVNGKNAVHCYQDLSVYRLISDFPDRDILREVCHQVLGPLLQYDEENNGALTDTLRAYIESDMCQKTAAQKLYLHRNSLKYRLKLIENLLGENAMKGHGLIRLHLALTIHTILSRLG